jgi:hypothetical protein
MTLVVDSMAVARLWLCTQHADSAMRGRMGVSLERDGAQLWDGTFGGR